MVIDFTIPGEPKGKGRPRFTKSGHTYTPKETSDYETLVKICCAKVTKVPFPEGASIKMEIIAYFGIPKTAPKYKRIAMAKGEIRPTKKPDIDNIEKIVMDALNGIVYKDDKQIVELHTSKHYSGCPRVEVYMEEI